MNLSNNTLIFYFLILVAISLAGLLASLLAKFSERRERKSADTTEPGAGGHWSEFGKTLYTPVYNPVSYNAVDVLNTFLEGIKTGKFQSAAATSPPPSSEATGDGSTAPNAGNPVTLGTAPETGKNLINEVSGVALKRLTARARVKLNGQYVDEKELAPSIRYTTNRGMVVRMHSKIKRIGMLGCYCSVCEKIFTNQLWTEDVRPPILKFSVSEIWGCDCRTCMTLRGDYEAALVPWAWSADQTSLVPAPTRPEVSNLQTPYYVTTKGPANG